ncbi:MAG: hypothetical protein AAF664_24540 [Planctomycetota bacterium]
MKRFFAPLLCCVLLGGLIASRSYADDEVETKEEPKSEEQVEKSKSSVSARIVIVGPDGKRDEIKFSGDDFNKDDMLKGLPEETRKRVEKILKNKTGEMPFNFDLDIDADLQVADSLEDLPDRIREMVEQSIKDSMKFNPIIARGFSIGADGDWDEFEFNGDGSQDFMKGMPENVRKQIRKAMEQNLRAMEQSKEAMDLRKKAMEQSLKAMEQSKEAMNQSKARFLFRRRQIKDAMDTDVDVREGDAGVDVRDSGEAVKDSNQSKHASSLEKKLDLILSRLESLESDVAELKAK